MTETERHHQAGTTGSSLLSPCTCGGSGTDGLYQAGTERQPREAVTGVTGQCRGGSALPSPGWGLVKVALTLLVPHHMVVELMLLFNFLFADVNNGTGEETPT
ncbi:hypothetical protein Bbelb_393620 [Branchiostoma belcheri]|nr:hypothetical protein Bbelb_393620 [Branchiostoma belcheri]